jgi:ketosteroid isomerase-like protein
MSQENVELVRRALDAFNRRDLDAMLALADDELEAVPLAAVMDGSYHGHEGMRRWVESWVGAFPDWKIEVVEVRDLGDVTVTAMRLRGHGAGSDIPLDQALWQVARWRRGKYVWWGNFRTEAEALEAVGLSE